MPTTEYQGSGGGTGTPSVPLSFRSFISMRRNQVISIEEPTTTHQEQHHLHLFQKHISDHFLQLSSTATGSTTTTDNILSITWLRKLLDTFLSCESQFKILLNDSPSHITKPPLDHLIPELLDRAIKSLDICNAITHGLDSILHYHKLAKIAITALEQKPLGEAQLRRAKKALNSLLNSMTLDDKDTHTKSSTDRTWSFGQKGGAAAAVKDRNTAKFRSLSLSVSRTWSAGKQIQAMSANLVFPRAGDSSGLALPVYIMSTVLVFVMWFLVAAIPCQDRNGIATHLHVPPRQLGWAGAMIGLQEQIAEEWKKKEKKGSTGLLDELVKLERCGLALIELADSVKFPIEAEQAAEINRQAVELSETCRKMEEGLIPLRGQVREVFHRIVRSRGEVLEALDQAGKSSAQVL